MKKQLLFVLITILCLGYGVVVHAELQPRARGLAVYDTAKNITYLANGNVALFTDIQLGFEKPPGIRPDGGMNYLMAVEFIESMNDDLFLGSDQWRIPIADENCFGPHGCDNNVSELGYIFYIVLNGTQGQDLIPGPSVANIDPFINIYQYGYYWTTTPHMLPDTNYAFSFSGGSQIGRNKSIENCFLWPVADGDIGGGDDCALRFVYGKNSEEVVLFRKFRNEVLRKSPVGQEIIKLYYLWSPIIVKTMEADEEFKQEVKDIVDGVLGVMK